MIKQSLIDALTSMIGTDTEPTIIEVEKGMIKRFAEAIEDPNPLWHDENYAKESKYGQIIAPPGFIHTIMMLGKKIDLPQMASMAALDGGGDWKYLLPIKAGDTITVINKLTDVKTKEGRLGKMFFVFTESTWKNQREEVVAAGHSTTIYY